MVTTTTLQLMLVAGDSLGS